MTMKLMPPPAEVTEADLLAVGWKPAGQGLYKDHIETEGMNPEINGWRGYIALSGAINTYKVRASRPWDFPDYEHPAVRIDTGRSPAEALNWLMKRYAEVKEERDYALAECARLSAPIKSESERAIIDINNHTPVRRIELPDVTVLLDGVPHYCEQGKVVSQ